MATTTKREEVDAGDYSHKKSKDYEEDDAYMPYKKDTYYDRRQQRVAPRSLLPGDLFGNAVCISGPWAVVGGSCGEGCPGSAYFYQLRAGKWRLVQKVKAWGSANGDHFGGSCGMDKDTAFVGSTSFPSAVPGPGAAVHIFRLKAGKWREVQQLLPIDAYVTGFGGFSIAVSKPRAIISAPTYNRTGAVYIFTETRSGKWEQTAFFTAGQMPGGPPPSFFGGWVGISGRIVTCGATDYKSTGAAYVLEFVDKMWVPTKLDFSTAALTEFGWATAISGYTVVVGDGLADKSVGANYVFERHGLGNWVFTQKLSAPLEVNPMANDQFSWLTSISGNYMISSAFPTPLDRAGYAVIYKKQGSTWVEHEVLTPDDGPPANLQATQTETTKSKQSQMPGFPGNGFGICPSISGRWAVVGSVVPFQSRGAAYFFDLVRD